MDLLECIVRKAVVDDLGEVMLVELQSFREQEAYPLSFFLHAPSLNPELFMVVECNGRIRGYALGSIEDSYCHLMSIAVEPNSRRRGLGRRLLRSFEEKCLNLGLRGVILEVRVDNIAALNLYRAEGYTIRDRITGYYWDGMDAYVMVKNSEFKVRIPHSS